MTAVLAGRAPRLGLLRQRRFRLLWIGETTSNLGSNVSSVALPLVALGVLHANVFAVSLLSAAAWLPWLVIALPAGAIVDRLPRRTVMLIADLVSIAAFASVPVASLGGWLTMTQLLIVALLAGCATVFFETAYRALLPAMVAKQDLLEGNAKLQGSEQVTHVTGPGLAGLIAQLATPIGGVVANAVSFAVSAACLSQIEVAEPAAAPRRRLREEIGDGLKVVLHEPLLRVNAVFGCLTNFVLTGYQSILVVFLLRVVGVSAGVTGLLLALASLGGVIGALAARRLTRKVGTARAVLIAKLGVTPFALLIPLAHQGLALGFFVLGSMIVIGGIVAGNITWSGWVQTYYPREQLGRISTSVQVLNYGAIPFGAVVAGATASAIGVRSTLWILMVALIVSSLILLIGPLKTLRDLPA